MTTPPNAADTERALIGAVLTWPDQALAHLEAVDLDAERFYTPAMRRAWEAVTALCGDGKPVDPQTVAAALDSEDRQPLAEAIAQAAPLNPAHVTAWAEIVVAAALCRQMMTPLRAALAACQDGRADTVFDLLNAVLDAGEVAAHVCK